MSDIYKGFDIISNALWHFGVPGMKCGVRKERKAAINKLSKTAGVKARAKALNYNTKSVSKYEYSTGKKLTFMDTGVGMKRNQKSKVKNKWIKTGVRIGKAEERWKKVAPKGKKNDLQNLISYKYGIKNTEKLIKSLEKGKSYKSAARIARSRTIRDKALKAALKAGVSIATVNGITYLNGVEFQIKK